MAQTALCLGVPERLFRKEKLVVTSTNKRSARGDGKRRGPAKLSPSAAEHYRPRLQSPPVKTRTGCEMVAGEGELTHDAKAPAMVPGVNLESQTSEITKTEPQPADCRRQNPTITSGVASDRPYLPTPEEEASIESYRARVKNRPPRIAVTRAGEGIAISARHSDTSTGYAVLTESFGSADLDFISGLLSQLPFSSKDPQVAEGELNFALSVIRSIGPRDQLEMMLAAQMAASHLLAMRSARSNMTTQSRIGEQIYDSAFNKSARTFAMQLDALKRYRTGGEQKITVQHVQNVSAGQAIVGNVTHVARETAPTTTATHSAATQPLLLDAREPTIPIIDDPASSPAPVRTRSRRKLKQR